VRRLLPALIVFVVLVTACAPKTQLVTLQRIEQAGHIVEELQVAENAFHDLGTISDEAHATHNGLFLGAANAALSAIDLTTSEPGTVAQQTAIGSFIASVRTLASEAGISIHERLARLAQVALTLLGAGL